jgi:RNA polymerase sigma-B factor
VVTDERRAQNADRLWSAYLCCPSSDLREQLIDLYRPLAAAIPRRLGLPVDEDVEQAALIGLVKAIDRFDPTRGFRFTSFAVPTIAGEVKRHFRDGCRLVRCPRSLLDLRAALRARHRELTAQRGHPPELSEVADALGVELERAVEALAVEEACTPRPLDGITGSMENGQALALEEHLGAEDPELARVEDRIAWGQLLKELEPRFRELLDLRFYNNLTQKETARRLGVSQMQVSRLERRALNQLREQVKAL